MLKLIHKLCGPFLDAGETRFLIQMHHGCGVYVAVWE
jgi:hypothetical protein